MNYEKINSINKIFLKNCNEKNFFKITHSIYIVFVLSLFLIPSIITFSNYNKSENKIISNISQYNEKNYIEIFSPNITFKIGFNSTNVTLKRILKNTDLIKNSQIIDFKTKEIISNNSIIEKDNNSCKTRGEYIPEFDVLVFQTNEIITLSEPEFQGILYDVNNGMKILSFDNYDNTLSRFNLGNDKTSLSFENLNETRFIGLYKCVECELSNNIFISGNSNNRFINTTYDEDEMGEITNIDEIENKSIWFEPSIEELIVEGLDWCDNIRGRTISEYNAFNFSVVESRATSFEGGFLHKIMDFQVIKHTSNNKLKLKYYTDIFLLDNSPLEVYLIKNQIVTISNDWVETNSKVGYFTKSHIFQYEVIPMNGKIAYIWNAQADKAKFPFDGWSMNSNYNAQTYTVGENLPVNWQRSGGSSPASKTGGYSMTHNRVQTKCTIITDDKLGNDNEDDFIKWVKEYKENKKWPGDNGYESPSELGDQGEHTFYYGAVFKTNTQNSNPIKINNYNFIHFQCKGNDIGSRVIRHDRHIPFTQTIKLDPDDF